MLAFRVPLSNLLSAFWSTDIDEAKASAKIGDRALSHRCPEGKHFIIAYNKGERMLLRTQFLTAIFGGEGSPKVSVIRNVSKI